MYAKLGLFMQSRADEFQRAGQTPVNVSSVALIQHRHERKAFRRLLFAGKVQIHVHKYINGEIIAMLLTVQVTGQIHKTANMSKCI